MKIWSVQTTEVYQEVKKKGIYQPDFEKSFLQQKFPR